MVSTPRIRLVKETINYKKGILSGKYVKGDSEIINFATKKYSNTEITAIKETSDGKICFMNSLDKEITHKLEYVLLACPHEQFNLEFEILYIGQVSKKRNSLSDRLSSHSTLQKIYFDFQNSEINKSLWILGMSFNNIIIPRLDIGKNITLITLDENIQSQVSDYFSEQSLINIIEAMLINYFKPEYNKNFKNTSLNIKQKTFKFLYSKSINTIGFDLHFLELGNRLSLMTREIEASSAFLKYYPLKNNRSGKNFFNVKN